MTDNRLPAIERVEAKALVPQNVAEALELAHNLADTAFTPKDMRGKPGDVFAAIALGLELGLGPITALQHIAVINGRPSVWGDLALALVMASGSLEKIEERFDDKGAACTVKRRNCEPVTREFTVEDAKRAGLLGKPGPWQQYPRRMLQMRARSWALRDVFPDVLRGVYIREEVIDIVPEAIEIAAPAGEKSKHGVAALKAAVAKKASGAAAPGVDEEPPKAKRAPLTVIKADGTIGSVVSTGTMWLDAYRREIEATEPEDRHAVVVANLETLRRLTEAATEKAAPAIAETFWKELETAEALAGGGGAKQAEDS